MYDLAADEFITQRSRELGLPINMTHRVNSSHFLFLLSTDLVEDSVVA